MQTIPPLEEDTFKTARFVARVVSFIGWVVVALSPILGAGRLAPDAPPSGVGTLFLAGGLVSGLGLVALGQLLRCFIAIERNTRAAFFALTERREA